MFEINVAAEQWAANHDGRIPMQLPELKGYVAPMTLICPSVRPSSLANTWENFDLKNISYQRYAPNPNDRWEFRVPPGTPLPATRSWLKCPVHNMVSFNRVMPGMIPDRSW
jgi:hypothetical protein